MAASSSAGPPPPPATEQPDSVDDAKRAYFDRPCREASIRAAARNAAQGVLFLSAGELAPPAAAQNLVGSPSAVEPSAAASLGGASGLLATSSSGVNAEIPESGLTGSNSGVVAITPQRKRERLKSNSRRCRLLRMTHRGNWSPRCRNLRVHRHHWLRHWGGCACRSLRRHLESSDLRQALR